MTIINVNREVVIDAFQSSNWPLFDEKRNQELFTNIPEVGIASYTTALSQDQDSQSSLIQECTRFLDNDLISIIPNDYSMWLFIIEPDWKPDTRINRYKQLWRTYSPQSLANLVLGSEVLFASSEGLRYAGLAEIPRSHLIEGIELTSQCSAIIITKREINSTAGIEELYRLAFSYQNSTSLSIIDWMMLASSLCPKGDLVIRAGADDYSKQWYIDLFASSEIIRKINSAVS